METAVPQTKSVAKPRSRILRGIYFLLGLICLGMVYISVLPGIPTFDFVILAAFFFSMSSDRVHEWMMSHPVFGKMIRGYRDGGLTIKIKWVAAIAIAVSLSISAFLLVDSVPIRLVLAGVGVFAIWFVFTRPTKQAPSRPSGDRL